MSKRLFSVGILFLFETVLGVSLAHAAPDSKIFSFHLQHEPSSLDPARIVSTDGAFFFPQLYRGLYRYSDRDGLVTEGAKSCRWQSALKLVCDLNPKTKWSDGSSVVAADYVRGFRHLLQENSKSPAIELLVNLENSDEVSDGRMSPDRLGISALSPTQLEIRFRKRDPDFLYKLTSPVLVPIKVFPFPERDQSKNVITNGPYKVSTWIKGQKIRLESNTFYGNANSARPMVDVYFVFEDTTALSLYREGRLKLLRRLPVSELSSWRKKPDLQKTAAARFDYLGFGPEMASSPLLREALSLSIDFAAFQKMLEALGRPGCPALPESFMSKVPCLSFDLNKAKEAWTKLPEKTRNTRYKLMFSAMGGDDIKRSAEFLQNQWSKHLGAKIDLEQTENGMFLGQLRQSAPAIFRKGIALDRPTCLSALENFVEGAPENFIALKDSAFNSIIKNLAASEEPKQRRDLCSEGITKLIKDYRLVPLGRYFYAYLVRPEFKGWEINEMNQLDLANLRYFGLK